jgi:mRNA interferase RelE/StbE
MSYELEFHPEALKEWLKLDKTIRDQFKKKLRERLLNPHVPASKLTGQHDRYKIKLRTIGYRLVYQVFDSKLVIVVVAVGKRERNAVYKTAVKR